MKPEEIYIALLDEGVNVWRPAPAWKVEDSTYIILRPDEYDPEDEHWEYPPGSTVVCEPRTTDQGTILAAVRPVHLGRQIA
jgi:hypothetical protein